MDLIDGQSIDGSANMDDLASHSSYRQDGKDGPTSSFIFDQSLLTSSASKLGLSFRMVINEIDIIGLKNAHSISKNSPFISIACGKWSNATMPIINAGNTAFWTKLGWKFNMKNNASLRIVVNSKVIIPKLTLTCRLPVK